MERKILWVVDKNSLYHVSEKYSSTTSEVDYIKKERLGELPLSTFYLLDLGSRDH